MRCLYTAIVAIYTVLIRLSALFLPKAQLWVLGRKQWQRDMKLYFTKPSTPLIWMHCASLGEYEQGKPLLQALKQHYPQYHILLTFFSPSGYEVRKHNAAADKVMYLPTDTYTNAKQFVKLCQPKLAIFVKYEFWYNYLHQLYKAAIPTVFISVIFRPQQYFFKWYGAWFRQHLKKINHIFVQNEESFHLLQTIGVKQLSVAGDTRFDSVLAIAKKQNNNQLVEHFKASQPLLLVGSSWAADEANILKIAEALPVFKILIAPHEIHTARIQSLMQLFAAIPVVQYTKATMETVAQYRVLILDTMGMLSSLYQYADYTWIGGGFGKGIHNTLEAAVFGMPILFGPKYQKFDEAKALVQLGVAKSINNDTEAIAHFRILMANQQKYDDLHKCSLSFVHQNKGSVNRILSTLQQKTYLH